MFTYCACSALLCPILGLHFALDHLDASTAPPSLRLSDSSLTVTYHEENPPVPAPEGKIRRPVMTSDPGTLHHIRADVVIAQGQYYWEVEVCNSFIYKIGKKSFEFVLVGLMPACLMLPEILTISQQDRVCSDLCSHEPAYTQTHLQTQTHGDVINSLHTSQCQHFLSSLTDNWQLVMQHCVQMSLALKL